MSRLKLFAIVALTLPVLGACALVGPDLETTRSMTPTGSTYNKALYQEYLALAQEEYDEGDSEDAVFFNNKAIAAAKGEKVLPQPVSERHIPNIKGSVFEAENIRDMIIAALDNGAAEKVPNHIARAQAMFDCWLQEFEENNQPKDIKRCRKGLDEAMKKVDAAMAEAPMPMPEPKPMPAEPKQFVFLFDFNSAKLSKAEMDQVRDIAAMEPTSVDITGYTDTSGATAYNEMLSKKRAEAVAAALAANGVAKSRLHVMAKGENDPARATGDNVKERLNRRVTVMVK